MKPAHCGGPRRNPVVFRGGCLAGFAFCLLPFAFCVLPSQLSAATGQLNLTVVDKETGKPVPFRMHLVGPKKRPARKPDKVPYWHDHFAAPGNILLKLPLGDYSFTIERGLEYLDQNGRFTINTFADDSKKIELRRFIDMAADGWWSGDLDVRRPVGDMELLMEADDLHVAQVVTWNAEKNPGASRAPRQTLVRFDGNRFYQWMAGSWARQGTELLLLNLGSPLKLPAAQSDYPPTMAVLAESRKKGDIWIDASRPYWWDLPMLVAAGQIDSIEIAHGNIGRDQTVNNEADGKPRDRKRYPSCKGNAEWSQEIYFRLLDCGLRIPPSAGSGSGDSPNPIGHNRVYVHVDGELTYDKWWQSLRAGQVFVTNGPLLKPSVEGEYPGHVFHADAGQTVDLEIGLSVSTRSPITYLEIIKDGHVENEIRFDQYAKTGKLPHVKFDRSGWFLLRAVADVPKTYRFAMTAPYYVEIGYDRRISRSACQFFLDWVYERARQIKLDDPAQQREVLEWHRKARDFWKALAAKANAE